MRNKEQGRADSINDRLAPIDYDRIDGMPTWDACKELVATGVINPLTKFIYEQEPASKAESRDFRDDLAKLIKYVQTGQE